MDVATTGKYVIIICCGSEAIRKSLTDNHLSVKLEYKNTLHHLNIMPYKGGGNKLFTISVLKPFLGNLSWAIAAVEKVYKTPRFAIWQYFDKVGDFRHDILLIKFTEPLKVLMKELQLFPNSKTGGYLVKIVPYSVVGKCKNFLCDKVIYSEMFILVKPFKARLATVPELDSDRVKSLGEGETPNYAKAPEKKSTQTEK